MKTLLLLFGLTLVFTLTACAEFKDAGRSIGHASKNAAVEIGHGSRDAAKSVAKGTSRVIDDMANGDDGYGDQEPAE